MNRETSESYFERAKKVSPGGVHSPVRAFRGVGGTPAFIIKAEGDRLYDVDGQSYVDFCMAWGPLLFGHQDAETADAVKRAVGRGWSYGTAEPYSLELAELIVSKLPWVEKLRFVNSGTEAVMSALRLARGATGRPLVVKFDGCYHGHVDSMLVKAGSGLAEMASPDSAGVSPQTAAETLVAPLDDLSALTRLFDERGPEIAAVIVEPMPANNGLLLQTPEFLKGMAALCKKHGALLIFDEVISGFRVAFGGMAEKTGIRPDLVTYGKVIGGGFPVGAYGGRAEIMDLVAPSGPVYQAGTLSANPVAMAAGLTTLRKLLRDDPYAVLEKRGEALARALAASNERHAPGAVWNAREGSVFWSAYGSGMSKRPVRAIPGIPATQKPFYASLFHSLLDRGYYLAPSGYEVGFLSMAHTDESLHGFAAAYDLSLKETAAKGLLGG
ncbi:MAG: glutamate-1-semialdehyde 2,1-aminomutase [Bdellovibrionales bacterium]|nr:glutamate-1-semialdehyde 2,1-aminomutase [Bdellovibrionales bacterium]